jgi:hypothetical protein
MHIYSIYDSKGQFYSTPFYSRNDDVATRDFSKKQKYTTLSEQFQNLEKQKYTTLSKQFQNLEKQKYTTLSEQFQNQEKRLHGRD